MIYTELTKKAMKLCFTAHKDQTDKSGLPYVFHPFHLAEQMETEYGTVVALLHDVMEDTAYTPEDLAAIIYTSGTTSSPKGVMLSHKAICSQVDIDFELFPVNEEDVFLSVLPLAHTYECSIGLLYAYACGSKVVYLDRPPTAAVLMPALKKVRPTLLLIVPLVIEKIFRSQVLSKFTANKALAMAYKLAPVRKLLHKVAGKKLMELFGGRMRFFAIGGAKFDSEAERFLKEAGFPYGIGYGLTETAPLLAGAVGKMVRIGSTGPALDGVELRLDNVNPSTGQGEIVAKTPCCMSGYYKNDEATKDAFTADGWFRTGDLGYIAKDGWVFIKGRLKNMIVGPSGENIYPEDIEEVLNSNRFVAESVVTEEDGKLIALVHFDTSALEEAYDEFKHKVAVNSEQVQLKMEEIKRDVMEYVNSKVNRFSRIAEVIEEEKEFEKTPSKKIRRFLYTQKPGDQK